MSKTPAYVMRLKVKGQKEWTYVEACYPPSGKVPYGVVNHEEVFLDAKLTPSGGWTLTITGKGPRLTSEKENITVRMGGAECAKAKRWSIVAIPKEALVKIMAHAPRLHVANLIAIPGLPRALDARALKRKKRAERAREWRITTARNALSQLDADERSDLIDEFTEPKDYADDE